MENKGLLFIPDISGFTRFVTETEIDHSRLIIQELLELLINSNHMGLEISEIEGDAILFYKFGDPPDLKELYKQVEEMFCAFHSSLLSYENSKYCQCKACSSAIDLSLKVITHYGEFTGYNVKNFNKLIGKDLIVAHQLLKNDIPQHEYWLVTSILAGSQKPGEYKDWMVWNSSAKFTERGAIQFHYVQLSQLKNQITHQSFSRIDLSGKKKIFMATKVYNTDIITLFHATGDFNYKSQWMEGVQRVEEVSHFLPRVGMRSRAILDNGETVIYSSSYFYSDDRIEFSETDDSNNTMYFTLEKIEDRKTKFTLDYYIEKHPIKSILFSLTKKKKLKERLNRSMLKLDKLAEEMRLAC